MSLDLESDVDLYESDLQKIRAVGAKIKALEGTWSEPEPIAAQITEMFAEAGYRCDTMLGVVENAGTPTYKFYLRIVGRIDPDPNAEFDHERQAFEVRQAEGVPISGLKDSVAEILKNNKG